MTDAPSAAPGSDPDHGRGDGAIPGGDTGGGPGSGSSAGARVDLGAEAALRRRGRTLKLATIVAAVVGAGLGLAGATQNWYTVTLAASAGRSAPVVVAGSDASPALTALSLAALALALALAIAGRLARVIVGVLGLALGVCVVISATGDPAASAGVRSAVSKATGIEGTDSVRALIAAVHTSAWPVLAVVGGALVILAGLAAILTGRLWPGGSRRYDAAAARFEDEQGRQASVTARRPADRPGDAAVDDWDELTRGDDPTAR